AGAHHRETRRHRSAAARDSGEETVKHPLRIAAPVAVVVAAALAVGAAKPGGTPIPPTAVAQDSLIRPGERHFAHLWQLTFGGENAEGYFSNDGRKLIWQSTGEGWPCDQEYVMDLVTGQKTRVSTGKGRTTCGY